MSSQITIGAADGKLVSQLSKLSNRHGIIAGATGTGKTVTLQVLAEGFSRLGVPVFAADIKGDLSGLGKEGAPHVKIDQRLAAIPLEDFKFKANPVVFWDLFGKTGHPIRTTISEMGPLLLGNLLDLNETQTGILYACFQIADDEGLLLLDLKDLRSMLSWMADNASELSADYGNISKSSVAAIQRRLLVLQQQGGSKFFGEPALELTDLIRVDENGHGVINLLDATKLSSESPKLYTTFLLWLLSELFEQLPEVGDPDKPRLVFFFDEAHLLFKRAPNSLLDKIEQVVRLIRSKGVGIYFISQNPTDIPENVLGQLGLRIQHALRAFTPKDKKTVKAVANNFRPNPSFSTMDVITNLGIGEALVSSLDLKGSPTIVEKTLISPPQSRIGPLKLAEKKEIIQNSPISDGYNKTLDRKSAHEVLSARAEKVLKEKNTAKKPVKRQRKSNRQGVGEAFLKSIARSVGSQLGRRVLRGILGSILK
jgi:DNA helicase HerA-like ATPase